MSDFYQKGEEYDIPSTSNYMKFQEGDNRFRILGAFSENTAIQGVEYWTTVDDKRVPKRLHKGEPVPMDELEINKFGEQDIPKFFWTFPVWNYQEKRVQILEITQSTILTYIKKVIDNPKWGDPRDYDFIVTRTEVKGKTVYTLTNDPKEELDKEISELYKQMNINLEALFSGDDPFASKGAKIDPKDVPDNL